MFENFVIFTEAVKLSPNVFWRTREVNYHNKLLDLIYREEDVLAFEQVTDLIENEQLINKFINVFTFCYQKDEKRWLENIFKVITKSSIKNNFPQSSEDLSYFDFTSHNNPLLIYSCKYGFYDFVKFLVERPDCLEVSRYREKYIHTR